MPEWGNARQDNMRQEDHEIEAPDDRDHGQLTLSPTLIVGVGGAGCKIARRLKQTMLAETPPEDHERIMVRFIGIDTDQKERARQSLEEADLDFCAHIAGDASAFKPEDPSMAPLLSWLPTDSEGKVNATRKLKSGQGAGGCRLIGRFAYNYFGPSHFPSLERQLQDLLDLRKNPLRSFKGAAIHTSSDLTVFVVGSFAGGTGSGCFLDAIATCHQIIDKIAPGISRHVNGVFLLPSVFAGRIDGANLMTQRATAYSCFRDLELLLGTDRKDLLSFQYFDRSFTVNHRFLNNVYLVDLNTRAGSIVSDEEIYRLVASQMFAMIGSPIGAHKLSVANNDWITGDKDSTGGNRYYCSLGVVGVSYDQETLLQYAAATLGLQALARLQGASDDSAAIKESFREQATQILSEMGFANDDNALFLRDVQGAQEATSEDDAEDYDEMKPAVARAKLRTTFDNLRGSGSRLQDRMRSNTRFHLLGQATNQRTIGKAVESKQWRANLQLRLLRALAELGVGPTLAITEYLCEQLNRLSGKLDTSVESLRQSVSQSEANFEAAYNELSRAGGLEGLLNRSKRNQAKLDAVAHLGSYRANLHRLRATEEGRTAITDGHDGLLAFTMAFRSELTDLKSTLDAASHELLRIKFDIEQYGFNSEVPRGALDATDLMYELHEPQHYQAMVANLPETKVNDLLDAVLRSSNYLSEAHQDATVAKGYAIRTLPSRLQHKKKTQSSMLTELVDKEASNALPEWKDRHILDLMRGNAKGVDEISAEYRRILQKVAPRLQSLTAALENPGEREYKMAFVMYPDFDPIRGEHAKLDKAMVRAFQDEAESAIKASLGTNAVSIFPGVGRNNRILMLCSRRGIPLTDFRLAELPALRDAYLQMRKKKPCFDVDKRWSRFPGPGMRGLGEAREALFALAMAYGLIARKGNFYYNNLPTKLDRDVPTDRSERDRYEVSLEELTNAFNDTRHSQQWFAQVCLGPSAEATIPTHFGFQLGKHKSPRRSDADRLAQGRTNAMEHFVGDIGEDFEDVAAGIRFFMKRYLAARGTQGVLEELAWYCEKLEREIQDGSSQRDQLQKEFDLLEELIEDLKETGRWKFDEEV